VLRFSTPFFGAVQNGYTELRWFTGTTEGGSSGAGVWYFDGNEYLFRGGLWGGTALCSVPDGTDHYSRFDLIFPALRAYLEPFAVPFANFTDLWWGGDSQTGWGLNLIQHPNNIMFVVWYTYDLQGKRIWYFMSNGSWESSGRYTGELYVASGPPYNAPFNRANFHVQRVGTGTLDFSSPNAGTWTYSVNGITGAKAIVRQPY
jgi:lysyl endopeptidase